MSLRKTEQTQFGYMGTRPMDKTKAKESLLEIKEIFDNLKIKFWLACGSCLGAVREGHFIPYDFDIDIIMLVRDFSPKISGELSKIAPLHFERHWPDKLAFVSFSMNQIPIHIKLKYYFSPEDIYIWLHPRPHWQNCVMPGKSLRNDYRVNFLDTKFRVPNPPEEYLERLYGKNWRTPINPRFKGRYPHAKNLSWVKQRKLIPFAKFAEYVQWIEEHPKEF